MTYRRRLSLTEAICVKDLVYLSKSQFSKLPDWVRDKMRADKIFIGMSNVIIRTSDGKDVEAYPSDFILLTEAKRFICMTETEFNKEYQEHAERS